MAIVLHHSSATGTAKLILLGIANHEGDGGAWPAVDTLMQYANCDRRTVQRSIDKLIEAGELRRLMQQGGTHRTPNSQRPNLYKIAVVCPPNCDRTTSHKPVESGAALTPPRGTDAAPGAAPTPPKPSTNHPTDTDQEERRVGNRASGHRHSFDSTSGYCGCGYRDDGRLVDPKSGIQFQAPIAERVHA